MIHVAKADQDFKIIHLVCSTRKEYEAILTLVRG